MFLKNRDISSKIKRSKVTDYAALKKTKKQTTIAVIQIGALRVSLKYSVVYSPVHGTRDFTSSFQKLADWK